MNLNRTSGTSCQFDGADSTVATGHGLLLLVVESRVIAFGCDGDNAIVVEILGDEGPIFSLVKEETLRSIRILSADIMQHDIGESPRFRPYGPGICALAYRP